MDSRGLVGEQFQSPTLDWNSPPTRVKLPEISDLVNLPDYALHEGLQRFGFMDRWIDAEQAAAKYVERITRRTWTKADLDAEIRRLATTDTTEGTRRLTKRCYHQYTLFTAIGNDDPSKVAFIRIGEGDDGQCDSCYSLQGEEGTMAYHQSIGMPGAQSCDGGDDCRCMLMRVN